MSNPLNYIRSPIANVKVESWQLVSFWDSHFSTVYKCTSTFCKIGGADQWWTKIILQAFSILVKIFTCFYFLLINFYDCIKICMLLLSVPVITFLLLYHPDIDLIVHVLRVAVGNWQLVFCIADLPIRKFRRFRISLGYCTRIDLCTRSRRKHIFLHKRS